MISEMLSYPFIVRALLAGLFVSVAASLLGVSLVLRRFSMIGDGLSHVGFGALGISALLSLQPMAVTIPVVIVSAFVLLHISGKSRSGGDSAIALISSSALALGVIAVSAAGVNTDLNAFLFGSILSVSRTDSLIAAAVSAATIFSYLVFYHQIYSTTFDPSFAKATGINTGRYTSLLALLTALVIVVGMRILGSLLISSLIIFPAAIAMKLMRRYATVSIAAAAEAVLAFIAGFVLSYAFSLPTGASIVAVHMVIYLTASAARSIIILARERRAP